MPSAKSRNVSGRLYRVFHPGNPMPGKQISKETGMIIDCDRCQVRGIACGNCVVPLIEGDRPDLDPAEIRALTALADAGMIPPLRYVPRMAKAS
jgi:hypothetical protein